MLITQHLLDVFWVCCELAMPRVGRSGRTRLVLADRRRGGELVVPPLTMAHVAILSGPQAPRYLVALIHFTETPALSVHKHGGVKQCVKEVVNCKAVA
jgi:hypothetical protein